MRAFSHSSDAQKSSQGNARAREGSECGGDDVENITFHLALILKICVRDSQSVLHNENSTDPNLGSGGEKE
jgi:hypothetical protein